MTAPSTAGAASVAIEVACALPERQLVVALEVPSGTTALEAVALAGIAAAFPEVTLDPARIGVHGRLLGTRGLPAAARYVLREGDRVEVYRPLLADPKAARRRRAGRTQPASMPESGTGTASGMVSSGMVSSGTASGASSGVAAGVSSSTAPASAAPPPGAAAPEGM